MISNIVSSDARVCGYVWIRIPCVYKGLAYSYMMVMSYDNLTVLRSTIWFRILIPDAAAGDKTGWQILRLSSTLTDISPSWSRWTLLWCNSVNIYSYPKTYLSFIAKCNTMCFPYVKCTIRVLHSFYQKNEEKRSLVLFQTVWSRLQLMLTWQPSHALQQLKGQHCLIAGS